MTEYYLVFLLTLLIQLYPFRSNVDHKRQLFFTFLPLFLFGALRTDFGNDHSGYESYFEAVHRSSNIFHVDDHMEKGYALLNYVMPNFRALLVFGSLLMCFSYASLFYKFVKPNYTWLAVLMLFLSGDKTIFFTLSAMRNGIAVSVLVLSVSFIENRKIFSFIIITLLTYYIHTSALFFFPIAYIIASNKQFSRRFILIWSISALIMLILSATRIIDYIEPFISRYFDRYEPVIGSMRKASQNRGSSLLALSSSISLMIGTFYYVYNTRLNSIENTVFKISLLFSFSFLLGALNARVSQYYILFFIVATTSLFAKWNKVLFKYAYLVLVLSVLGYGFFVVWMGSPYFAYKEYHSLLGNFILNMD